MRSLISEEMLDVLVPSADFGEISALLRTGYAGIADGISLRMPAEPRHDTAFTRVVSELRGHV